MNIKVSFALILAVIFLAACSQLTPPSAYPPPGSTVVTPAGDTSYPGPTSEPTNTAPIPVDLTPAQLAAVQALSEKYNIPIDQIKIISTEAATWPNGCLGVVIPGIMCTDAIVDGFLIILEANGQQYEFRTNQDGTNVVEAAQAHVPVMFVVQAADHSIQAINPSIPLGSTYNPAFNGFLPMGGSVPGVAYVLDLTAQSRVVAVDSSGSTQELAFIDKPTYGLAVWAGDPGTRPMVAWGTQLNFDNGTSNLQIANLDGSNLQTVLTNTFDTGMPVQLVAQLWSDDGRSLYFSKEPVGLGGYIPFSGASNLYQVDIATGAVSEIIPQAPATGPQTCLDAMSGDHRYVADHCTQNEITIRDLENGSTTAIQAPTDATGYQLLGSARFSPDGNRVAFALAEGNPDNEQGWVAVGDRSGGVAKLILTGGSESYYTVLGWLDDQTILVQSTVIGDPTGINQVFTVSIDGSNLTNVADGNFLTVMDTR